MIDIKNISSQFAKQLDAQVKQIENNKKNLEFLKTSLENSVSGDLQKDHLDAIKKLKNSADMLSAANLQKPESINKAIENINSIIQSVKR